MILHVGNSPDDFGSSDEYAIKKFGVVDLIQNKALARDDQ